MAEVGREAVREVDTAHPQPAAREALPHFQAIRRDVPVEPTRRLGAGNFGRVVEVRDKSAHLNEHRYWGSYNVPAIPEIWRLSAFGSAPGPAWAAAS